jgi:hypothetical protein
MVSLNNSVNYQPVLNNILYGSSGNKIASLAITTGQTVMGSATIPIATGSPSFSGLATAATGLTATAGNVTATAGNVVITAGNLTLPGTNGTGTQGEIQFGGSRFISNFGSNNTFVGSGSGNTVTTSGFNTGVGTNVLQSLTGGGQCVAVGYAALQNTTGAGANNTAIGYGAMITNTTGTNNVSVGYEALISLLTGTGNVCIGSGAGSGYTGSENYNVIIGLSTGTAGQSGTTMIGTLNQTSTCIIYGVPTTIASGTPVVVSTSGGNYAQLGILSSSQRYKENIEEMGNFSDRIYTLRPVTFSFKNDADKKIQPGLIAEEVLTQFPELVTFNNQGDPETVAYHLIPVLLLNELKKQKQIIEDLNKKISLYLGF